MHNIFLIFLFIMQTGGGVQDEASVRRILHNFLDLNSSKQLQNQEAQDLLAGEARLHWTSPTIGPFGTTIDRVVFPTSKSAVARVPTELETGERKDFYFYFDNDSTWKVTAMRTLATVGILYMIRDDESMPANSYYRRNAKLTLFSDNALGVWYKKHKVDLRSIVNEFKESGRDSLRVDLESPSLEPLYIKLEELGLSSLKQIPNGVKLVIGGILDNTVGFLVLPKKTPPSITPNEYIWIEELEEDWYLFRTT